MGNEKVKRRSVMFADSTGEGYQVKLLSAGECQILDEIEEIKNILNEILSKLPS